MFELKEKLNNMFYLINQKATFSKKKVKKQKKNKKKKKRKKETNLEKNLQLN